MIEFKCDGCEGGNPCYLSMDLEDPEKPYVCPYGTGNVNWKEVHKPKVFLGGTCADSTWREELIPHLKLDYFNPVVTDWDDEAYEEELRQRETCDICLYVISKEMKGVYSIAEIVDDAHKRPEKVVFAFLKEDLTESLIKSLIAVSKMVDALGATVIPNATVLEVAEVLNGKPNN